MTPEALRDEILHHLRRELELPAQASVVRPLNAGPDNPGIPAIEVETESGPVYVAFLSGDQGRPCTAEEEAQLERENDW